MHKTAVWTSFSGVGMPPLPAPQTSELSLEEQLRGVTADRDALIADVARKRKKIIALTEEVVALRRENAPKAAHEQFPIRALNRRTHGVGLVVRWPHE